MRIKLPEYNYCTVVKSFLHMEKGASTTYASLLYDMVLYYMKNSVLPEPKTLIFSITCASLNNLNLCCFCLSMPHFDHIIKINITRWPEDMNCIFWCKKQHFTRLLRSLVKYCFHHSKIKFISLRHHTISSMHNILVIWNPSPHLPPRQNMAIIHHEYKGIQES